MIQVSATAEAMSRMAAEFIAATAREALEARGRFILALAGGGTPRPVYERLAAPPLAQHIDWSRTHVFWGDERCVSEEDERSNYRMARESLLEKVPLASGQVHPIRCDGDPAASALRYEQLLRSMFPGGARFDLILLGLGDNGHTASLFPDTPAVEERERWVAETRIAGQDYSRVTLTVAVINEARSIAFLVSGAEKAEALNRVLEGPRNPRSVPAQAIHPRRGRVVWFVDAPAARLLNRPAAAGGEPR